MCHRLYTGKSDTITFLYWVVCNKHFRECSSHLQASALKLSGKLNKNILSLQLFIKYPLLGAGYIVFKLVRCNQLWHSRQLLYAGLFPTKISMNVLHTCKDQPWNFQANWARTFSSYAIFCQTSSAGHRLQHFFQITKVQSKPIFFVLHLLQQKFPWIFFTAACSSPEIFRQIKQGLFELHSFASNNFTCCA